VGALVLPEGAALAADADELDAPPRGVAVSTLGYGLATLRVIARDADRPAAGAAAAGAAAAGARVERVQLLFLPHDDPRNTTLPLLRLDHYDAAMVREQQLGPRAFVTARFYGGKDGDGAFCVPKTGLAYCVRPRAADAARGWTRCPYHAVSVVWLTWDEEEGDWVNAEAQPHNEISAWVRARGAARGA
jgi:hypothetical protein